MIIFIAGVFSGHILVKKIILSELYCCNMIIFFCKLLKIKIVQTSFAKACFLLVKLCDLWPKAALRYGSFEGKKR